MEQVTANQELHTVALRISGLASEFHQLVDSNAPAEVIQDNLRQVFQAAAEGIFLTDHLN